MAEQLVTGPDGKQYIELPGGVRIPVDELKEPAVQPTRFDSGPQLHESPMHARLRGFGEGAASGAMRVLTPEVVGGLSALAAPETGGASLAVPMLAGAGTSLVRDAMSGERDPKTYAGHAAIHAGLNLAPSVAGALMPAAGGNAVAGAVDAAATDSNMIGTIAKALRALMRGTPSAQAATQFPQAAARATGGVADQIARLQQTLQTPGLNTQARAAVITAIKQLEQGPGRTVTAGLRGALGLGSIAGQP